MDSCSLSLTLKVMFLTAIASVRRVSELNVFLAKEPFCQVYQNKVILCPPQHFPKVDIPYNQNWEPVLFKFPQTQGEESNLVHLIQYYLRMSSVCKVENLFVQSKGPTKGTMASPRVI